MITKVLPEQKTKPAPVEQVATTLPWERARPKSKRGRWLRRLLPLVWLAAAAAAYYLVPRDKLLEWWKAKTTTAVVAAPARVIPVLAGSTRRGDMELYLNGLGSVTALYTVTLKTRVDGELMKVNFTEGQMVKQGELIAEIDPRPYYVMLKQAEGNLMRDQAALKVAQIDLDRYTALIGPKAITQQQLDAQIALVKQSQGAVKTDQAAIDNAKLQLIYCRITAPISGRIGLRVVDPGNMVHANDTGGLAVITQLQPITVVFTIPQDEISRVQKRINAGDQLTVDAYDRDFKTKLATGRLKALDNQVDTTTGTVRIKAIFANDDNMLFPNQFVNARLLVDTRRDAVIAPAAAVQRGPDSTFVYVVKPDDTVELKTVTIGPTEGDEVVIETGLAADEMVVVDGVDKLTPGTKVTARTRSGGEVKGAAGRAVAAGDAARGNAGIQGASAADTDPSRTVTQSGSAGRSAAGLETAEIGAAGSAAAAVSSDAAPVEAGHAAAGHADAVRPDAVRADAVHRPSRQSVKANRDLPAAGSEPAGRRSPASPTEAQDSR